MRIGVNCFLLQPDIGGIRQYFFNLFNELLVNGNDNEYLFFYFEHNIDELNRLRSDNWRENGILLKEQKDICSHWEKIDLYFCPFSTLSPRPVPVPSVYTLPDIQEVFYPQFFSSYNRVARAYHYVGSSKMADRIMTHSDFSKNTIVQYHKVEPEKIFVAHHSVDERFYRAGETGKRPEGYLPGKYLFFPANHWVHKNHDVLLRALAWLRDEKRVRVNLVVTGFDQENGYPLADKISEYELGDQVCLLGYVRLEEIAYLYANAQMLVFPSLFEGFGLPLVEAMAAGCPVLASNATSLPEIGGEAACYFDPSSHENLGGAITQLLDNKELRKEMVAKGLSRAKGFSAALAARKHLEAFEEAARVFSKRKYLWLKFFTQYYYRIKKFFMADSYRYFYERLLRKYNRIRVRMDEFMK